MSPLHYKNHEYQIVSYCFILYYCILYYTILYIWHVLEAAAAMARTEAEQRPGPQKLLGELIRTWANMKYRGLTSRSLKRKTLKGPYCLFFLDFYFCIIGSQVDFMDLRRRYSEILRLQTDNTPARSRRFSGTPRRPVSDTSPTSRTEGIFISNLGVLRFTKQCVQRWNRTMSKTQGNHGKKRASTSYVSASCGFV